jgi:hypothetical protein
MADSSILLELRYNKLMRLLTLLAILSLAGCGGNSTEQSLKEQKKEEKPVDLSDPNVPIEIRAYKGAKQVKKEMEKRKEEIDHAAEK